MVTLAAVVSTVSSASFHHITARLIEGLGHFHITLHLAVLVADYAEGPFMNLDLTPVKTDSLSWLSR
jgi:hypothetical protein